VFPDICKSVNAVPFVGRLKRVFHVVTSVYPSINVISVKVRYNPVVGIKQVVLVPIVYVILLFGFGELIDKIVIPTTLSVSEIWDP